MSFVKKINQEKLLDFEGLSPEGKNTTKKYIIVIVFCLFLSLLFLSIGTKSSPLYPFNDWVDANASFTMGKAMMNEKVLYRDIFNQKGPLYYLLFGLAYLISNTTFLGVFVFEVLSFSIFLYYSFKLANLFIDFKFALITLPLITVSVINLKSFTHGGSAEELCLPLVAIGLYTLFNYLKNIYPDTIPNQWVLVNGILAGCVLWIKFSVLGFWFGWMASVLIVMLLNKQVLPGIKASLVFLSGMLIATLPWVVYFGLNHSIYEWINAYFIINLTSYSEEISISSRLMFILRVFFIRLGENPLFAGHFIFGLIVFLKGKKYNPKWISKLCLICCLLFLMLSVYGGGRGYIYYFLIFAPFIIFGFIGLLSLIDEELGEIKAKKYFFPALLILIIISFFYTRLFNHNVYMLEFDKEDLVQYKFANIITETEGATLLNFGNLDAGFYTTTGIVPNIRFFQNLNIDYVRMPLILDEQLRYIREKFVDYIVVIEPLGDNEKVEVPYLYENYVLISRETQKYQGKLYKYFLFTLK